MGPQADIFQLSWLLEGFSGNRYSSVPLIGLNKESRFLGYSLVGMCITRLIEV